MQRQISRALSGSAEREVSAFPELALPGVGASEPTSGFITPVRRTAAINTGVALSNPEIHAVNHP